MTEAMPFLQKAILLSYDPRPFDRGFRYIFDFSYFPYKTGILQLQ